MRSRSRVAVAALALVSMFAMSVPPVVADDAPIDCDLTENKLLDECKDLVPTPKPTKPAPKPTPAPTQDTPDKPAKDPKKPLTEEEKKKAEEEKKKSEEAAAAHAAAEAALVEANNALDQIQPSYDAARKRLARAKKREASLQDEIAEAKLLLSRIARQAYVEGVDPSVLDQTALLTANSPDQFADSQVLLGLVGESQNSKLEAALDVIVSTQKEIKDAQAAFDAIKPQYDLIQLNVAAYRSALGLGSPLDDPGKFFADYPIPNCSFERAAKTTVSCQDAMRWAIQQVQHPTEDWFYLCLKFVTVAYGAPQGTPRAIDMWNTVPAESRHSPNTIAPPGALMFWAPNHVALSLGNNMLVSIDVLGRGRAWIVSLQTIQARWNMPYLGWTDPDWSNA